jgi:hypothetical protein
MNTHLPRLVFVYNADSGMFNTLADIGHKIFSPETYACDLCALTHGYFSERREWRTFIESLAIPCEFLHRDEFVLAFPEQKELAYPVVLLVDDKEQHICLSREDLAACNNLDTLKQAIINCIANTKNPDQ